MYTEPRPDLTVADARPDLNAETHPTPSDIRLAIEVTDSSLVHDRHVRVRRYADAMIPEVCLTELEAEVVTICTEPEPLGYVNEKVKKTGRHHHLSER